MATKSKGKTNSSDQQQALPEGEAASAAGAEGQGILQEAGARQSPFPRAVIVHG